MRLRYILSSMFFVGLCIWRPCLGVEDTYHQSLRSELQLKYGLTGGSWILSDNEQQTNNLCNSTNVIVQKIDWQNSEPFSKVLRLRTTQTQSNAWDAAIRFTSAAGIEQGDALLLVVWMRQIDVDEEENSLTHIYELVSDPYTKSLNAGGTPPDTWKQWLLPFESAIDYPSGQSRYQINLGNLKGIMEIAGLAILNYGQKYSVDELPTSNFIFDYEGRAEGAPWRTAALQRIENIRKSAIRIIVENESGNAVQNATVHLAMTRHHFGFGTAVSAYRWIGEDNDSEIYREKLADLTGDGRTFNIAVIENALKWPNWERTDGSLNRRQLTNLISRLVSYGMRVRGHNLVWPLWNHLPDDLEENANNPNYIDNRIDTHIHDEAGWPGIKGVIAEWDVINEMSHCFDLRDVYGTEDIYSDWMTWAREADPAALLYINEYSIINGAGKDKISRDKYKEIIERLIEQGAPLDGIGVQGHFGTNLTPPQRILDILDEFELYGKDISITEYDAAGTPEDAAADYMRDILIAAYSHPAMRNFLMWGFWDGAHWYGDAPIYTIDWRLKPSGAVFIDYVFNKWWTDEVLKTDSKGLVSTSGYHGEYNLTVTYDGRIIDHTFTLIDEGEKTVRITGSTIEESMNKPADQYSLGYNYPNPFNHSTKIFYTIPEEQNVKLSVYDLQGRVVKILQNGMQSRGAYEVTFNGESLATGIYIYRLEAGSFLQTKKMALIK